MKYLLLLLLTTNAFALTAKEAQGIADKKNKYKAPKGVYAQIKSCAEKGFYDCSIFGVSCPDIKFLEREGFYVDQSSCAPLEFGGRCSCPISWSKREVKK